MRVQLPLDRRHGLNRSVPDAGAEVGQRLPGAGVPKVVGPEWKGTALGGSGFVDTTSLALKEGTLGPVHSKEGMPVLALGEPTAELRMGQSEVPGETGEILSFQIDVIVVPVTSAALAAVGLALEAHSLRVPR